MFKSKFSCVSNPSSSSRSGRSSSDSTQYGKSPNRSLRTPTPSSKSDDDEHEQQRNKDDEKKSEVRSKKTSNSSPARTTSAVPPLTGGLYMPTVNLRLLEAPSIDKSSREYQRTQGHALERNINLLVDQANESNI